MATVRDVFRVVWVRRIGNDGRRFKLLNQSVFAAVRKLFGGRVTGEKSSKRIHGGPPVIEIRAKAIAAWKLARKVLQMPGPR